MGALPYADARRLAAAEADIAAGRVVPNSKVIDWLKTWGRRTESRRRTLGANIPPGRDPLANFAKSLILAE
jgi:hypothetical protein